MERVVLIKNKYNILQYLLIKESHAESVAFYIPQIFSLTYFINVLFSLWITFL